ncbi:MAG: 5'-methylthioadenosine/adenosylhomocysteine nucleosidase [Oscillospiraceae bacterium]|nr:5'-methylthioadenosine/adenosylhomocysteine nucleosidase [Oscillospiraceae bacterium]
MLGIIGAMGCEVEKIVSCLDGAKETMICGQQFWQGKLGGRDVVVARCGAGKICAAMCAAAMVIRFGVSGIINTGIAGGLDKSLRQGDFVLAEDVVQHDYDTTGVGDPIGWFSKLKTTSVSCDPVLTEKLYNSIDKGPWQIKRGRIATGDQFIADEDKNTWIRDTFGAAAVEMEGAAIGAVCAQSGIPFAALRCISDGADGEAPLDFPAFARIAADRCADAVIKLMEAT